MTEHYHPIVWIDHHEARIFHFNVEEVDREVVRPQHPTRHIHHKANSIGSGHAAEDQEFLHQTALAIRDAGAVLIHGAWDRKARASRSIYSATIPQW